MAYGTTPLSTTTLGTNQFPTSAVYIQGTAGGNFTALQGGPASSADVSGNVSAPMAIYVPAGNIVDGGDTAQGTTTDPSSANTVIGLLKNIKGSVASVTIGSGTVTANQGGSWTVTANAGTNLNTSALALDTSVNGVILAQASTTSGQKGPLIQGAVTTSAPSYTTAQTSPISLTLAGAVRVDASATTQPVSGTGSFTVAQATGSNLHAVLDSGSTTAVTQATGTNLHTVVDSGAITANIGTTNGLALDATVAKLNVAQAAALGSNTGPMMQGSVTTNAPTYVTGNINPLSLDTSGLLRTSLKDTPSNTNNFNVNLAASAATVTVSGTVTANAGTNLNTSLLALDTSVNGLLVSQGSTTSGEKGPMVQGAVTTNAPSYTTAQTSPLSLDPSGLLRASLKDTPSNTNNFNVNLAASAATVTVTAANLQTNVAQIGGTNIVTGGASGLIAVGGPVASGGANADNPVKQGAVFNTAQPTVTNGQVVDLQATSRGAQIVATGADTFNATINAALPAGANTIGAVTQASGPWTSNVTQWNGTTTDTNSGNKSAGTLRVVLATDQPALTNALSVAQSGTWTAVPNAATTGGSTASHTMSAASTNATSLKGSAGQVYGLSISNANAAARYFKLYNKASAPTVGTDTPVLTLQVPGNGTVIRAYPVGLALGAGIAWAATGVITDADTTAIGLNDLSVDIDYK